MESSAKASVTQDVPGGNAEASSSSVENTSEFTARPPRHPRGQSATSPVRVFTFRRWLCGVVIRPSSNALVNLSSASHSWQ